MLPLVVQRAQIYPAGYLVNVAIRQLRQIFGHSAVSARWRTVYIVEQQIYICHILESVVGRKIVSAGTTRCMAARARIAVSSNDRQHIGAVSNGGSIASIDSWRRVQFVGLIVITSCKHDGQYSYNGNFLHKHSKFSIISFYFGP